MATAVGQSAAAGADAVIAGEGCTSILVGKDASTDGSVMTTHTCDCGTCDWTWRHVAAADHKPGSTRKIYHISQYKTWPPSEGLKWDLYKKDFAGLEIPEVAHTYAYHHGMFGYMNEKQVLDRRIDDRLPAQDAEPDAGGQARPDHADPARHRAGGHGPRGHPDHGLPGREIRLRLPRRRRDAGRRRPEGSLDLRDHAPSARCGPPRAASPARSGPPSASPTTTSASARTSRASARSTSTTRTSSWPRRTSSRWPSTWATTTPRAASPSTSSGPTPPSRAARRARTAAIQTAVALLRHRRPVQEVQARDAQHGPALLGQARQEALRPGRHEHDPRPELRHALRPRPGHPGRTVQEPQLLPRHPGHRPRPGRILHGHAEPGRAARSHRRHRLDRLRVAGHLLLHAALRRHDRDPQVVHGRRPLDLQPRFGPLGLRLHRFPRPGRLLRGHQGRPGGPGEIRDAISSPASRRSTSRPWPSTRRSRPRRPSS